MGAGLSWYSVVTCDSLRMIVGLRMPGTQGLESPKAHSCRRSSGRQRRGPFLVSAGYQHCARYCILEKRDRNCCTDVAVPAVSDASATVISSSSNLLG